MPLEFTIGCVIDASPLDVYKAWLSSTGHSRMTGSKAKVSAKEGETFSAWDGYIEGRNLTLERGTRIVQAWRTAHFAAAEPDSRLEVIFKPYGERMRITLHHSALPPHGVQYKTGWVTHYFKPMKVYFSSLEA
ncbi:MAG: SRPBCC domain-containing protein [Gammaproteobacteria bacterium]|nr:SRPBCC domain-containing protein [Gammaproteobacteria bacterium]